MNGRPQPRFKALLMLWFCVLSLQQAQAFGSLPDFTELVEENSAAVVNISTVQRAQARGGYSYDLPPDIPDIFRHFFGAPVPPGGQQPPQERASLGSGFIISKDGYVLTNFHVIDQADEVFVRLSDMREFKAELIGGDKKSDLALLKVKAKNLPAVKIGRSESLKVGEWVVAIGSPFGFDHSVTKGIVSAKGRALPNETYVPFIQTDVAINPGNSGGPLFNLKGEVVGINSQIYTRSGGFMGLSFAIPIDVAMEAVEQLKTEGQVIRGWLGVVIQEVDKNIAEAFGLDRAAGALVAQVEAGPASEAGIQAGDIIVEFNGKPIQRSADLPQHVGRVKPGTEAKIKVVREGKNKVLSVVVGARPSDGDVIAARGGKGKAQDNPLGIQVAALSDRQKESLRVEAGVLVEVVQQGAGARAGLQRGDVIVMINGQAINSVNDFDEVVANLPKSKQIHMHVSRRGTRLFTTFRLMD
jgi:serine protease Do